MPHRSESRPLRVLVNFVEAHNVGHVIEGLRYVAGHRAAAPDARIGLVLNRAAPTELARRSPLVDEVFDVPMYGSDAEVERALTRIPSRWDFVLDDLRRMQPAHAEVVPGFRRYYEAADRYFQADRGRSLAGVNLQPTPGYVPDQPVRLDLGPTPRARAADTLPGGGPCIALLPAGSSERWLYPSARSWHDVIGAFAARFPTVTFVLIGKLAEDERTASSFTRREVDHLLAAHPRVIDGFDRPLVDQLALVERCDLFLSTHSGFGWAAAAVGTPWLTLAGGRWPEVFFNHVPFVSVLPDPDRFGRYSLYGDPVVVPDDDGDGPRSPHATRERVRADLDRIVAAGERLLEGGLDVETAMREHFAALVDFLGDDREALFTVDRVHLRYTDGSP